MINDSITPVQILGNQVPRMVCAQLRCLKRECMKKAWPDFSNCHLQTNNFKKKRIPLRDIFRTLSDM